MNPALLMLQGAISNMSQEQQDEIKEVAQKFRELLVKHGENGTIALGLVGLEMQED